MWPVGVIEGSFFKNGHDAEQKARNFFKNGGDEEQNTRDARQNGHDF